MIIADMIIGIDPGKGGGIAVWDANWLEVEVFKMPENVRAMNVLFSEFKAMDGKAFVILEKVQLQQGDLNNTGRMYRLQKMFTNYDQLKTVLSIVGLPYIEVKPNEWQKYLRLAKKGEDYTDRKRRLKKAAGNLYRTTKVTLWNADALLLMEFGRRKKRNEPEWFFGKLPKSVLSEIMQP